MFDKAGRPAAPDWRIVNTSRGLYRALWLKEGEWVQTPTILVAARAVARCEIVGTVSDSAQAEIELAFDEAQGTTRALCKLQDASEIDVRVCEIDLDHLRGRLGRIRLRAVAGVEVGVVQLIVAPDTQLGLMRARTNASWRIANELAHFEGAYDLPLYANRASASGELSREDVAQMQIAPRRRKRTAELTVADVVARANVAPAAGENTYQYGHRILSQLIGRAPPNFAERFKSLAGERGMVRVLSLCSGKASVEYALLKQAGVKAAVTLYDINPKLLGQGKALLSEIAEVDVRQGDINTFSADEFDGEFDVIVCVSGLHHVVELEQVMREASALLGQGGEFWVIGEQIGRNGNQIWTDAVELVGEIFPSLPERLRKNAYTGEVDRVLPDLDASSGCFEGIRSSEIDALLLAHFHPVDIYRRNCFLWRLLDSAYFSNYDLERPEDRYIILGLVAAEYNHWRAGGRSTESHSVYGKK